MTRKMPITTSVLMNENWCSTSTLMSWMVAEEPPTRMVVPDSIDSFPISFCISALRVGMRLTEVVLIGSAAKVTVIRTLRLLEPTSDSILFWVSAGRLVKL